MDMICSGEQKPSAGLGHVLSCSLTTCFENCTYDVLCGWWEWRTGSSLLSDSRSVFCQKLKQTGVWTSWETLDGQGMPADVWISEIKYTLLSANFPEMSLEPIGNTATNLSESRKSQQCLHKVLLSVLLVSKMFHNVSLGGSKAE